MTQDFAIAYQLEAARLSNNYIDAYGKKTANKKHNPGKNQRASIGWKNLTALVAPNPAAKTEENLRPYG